MRAVIQRVKSSTVTVDGEVVGSVGHGFNILLGVMQGDTERQVETLALKISRLRVFEDEDGKMNKNILEVGGEALVVSQFTLCADLHKGHRPSFTDSAPPDKAEWLYRFFCRSLYNTGVRKVEKGVFGADMLVEINNDGPVTIVMDTDIWDKKG